MSVNHGYPRTTRIQVVLGYHIRNYQLQRPLYHVFPAVRQYEALILLHLESSWVHWIQTMYSITWYSLYLVEPGVSVMTSVQRCLFLIRIFGRTALQQTALQYKTYFFWIKIAVHNTFLDRYIVCNCCTKSVFGWNFNLKWSTKWHLLFRPILRMKYFMRRIRNFTPPIAKKMCEHGFISKEFKILNPAQLWWKWARLAELKVSKSQKEILDSLHTPKNQWRTFFCPSLEKRSNQKIKALY